MRIFSLRFCAFIIDCLILTVFFKIISFVTSLLGISNEYILGIVFYVIFILYFSIQESSYHQATIGKRILNLQVYTLNEERPSLFLAIWRNVARIINTFTFCLGYLPIIFTKNHQGLHDFVSKTVVVETYDYDEYEEE